MIGVRNEVIKGVKTKQLNALIKSGPHSVIGSAFDSRSKGYPFKSGWGQDFSFGLLREA